MSRPGLRTANALGALLLAACGTDTRIVGECHVDSEATLVAAPAALWAEGIGIGMLGDDVLVETSVPVLAAGWSMNLGGVAHQPIVAEPRGTGHTSRWVRDGDQLVGLVPLWGEVDPDEDMNNVQRCRTEPAHTICESLATDLLPDTLTTPRRAHIYLGRASGPVALEGRFPVVLSDEGVVSAFDSVPAECPDSLGNFVRLFLFPPEIGSARFVHPFAIGCEPAFTRHTPQGSPWLVALPAGAVGLLGRAWEGSAAALRGNVFWQRLTPAGELIGEARSVGGVHDWETAGANMQPRGIAMDGSAIFLERTPSANPICYAMRVINEDGSGAHDAPWQLPCMRDATRVVEAVELEPMGDHTGLLVWSERRFDPHGWVLSGDPYDEGVYAMLLTADGLRGSAILRVTPDDASSLDGLRLPDSGPSPHGFVIAASTEGSRAVVGWGDARVAEGGVYLRRLRCDAP